MFDSSQSTDKIRLSNVLSKYKTILSKLKTYIEKLSISDFLSIDTTDLVCFMNNLSIELNPCGKIYMCQLYAYEVVEQELSKNYTKLKAMLSCDKKVIALKELCLLEYCELDAISDVKNLLLSIQNFYSIVEKLLNELEERYLGNQPEQSVTRSTLSEFMAKIEQINNKNHNLSSEMSLVSDVNIIVDIYKKISGFSCRMKEDFGNEYINVFKDIDAKLENILKLLDKESVKIYCGDAIHCAGQMNKLCTICIKWAIKSINPLIKMMNSQEQEVETMITNVDFPQLSTESRVA